MKSVLAVMTVFLLFTAAKAIGGDVPFAEPPSDVAVANLDDIMGKIQLRHEKLWSAIQKRNWDLISYEAKRLKESFGSAVVYYRNIPVEYISAVAMPLVKLENAAKTKDFANVERDFAAFTAACNSCHQAGGVGFIEIKPPARPLFGNQEFLPKPNREPPG